jgi:hypothetical protein
LNRIVALPSPAAGAAVLIHDSSPRAFHGHPLVAVSRTEISPPAASTSWLVGETSYLHGAASCVNATRCCPTTTAPWRGVPFALGVTV